MYERTKESKTHLKTLEEVVPQTVSLCVVVDIVEERVQQEGEAKVLAGSIRPPHVGRNIEVIVIVIVIPLWTSSSFPLGCCCFCFRCCCCRCCCFTLWILHRKHFGKIFDCMTVNDSYFFSHFGLELLQLHIEVRGLYRHYQCH